MELAPFDDTKLTGHVDNSSCVVVWSLESGVWTRNLSKIIAWISGSGFRAAFRCILKVYCRNAHISNMIPHSHPTI